MPEPTHTSEQPVRPAATVIMMRDGTSGLEVLLLQRNRALAFHGGAWVFPGGAVDASDRPAHEARELATLDADAMLESARRAAVRELHEEAQLTLLAEALVPFAHWTTPHGAPRRFATWFFLARCPHEACVVTDGGEVHAHRWLSPREALSEQARGHLELPAPTFVSLQQLSAFAESAGAVEHARTSQPFVYVPRPHVVADGIVSLYAGDAAYHEGSLERDGPRHRLRMLKQGWRYERQP